MRARWLDKLDIEKIQKRNNSVNEREREEVKWNGEVYRRSWEHRLCTHGSTWFSSSSLRLFPLLFWVSWGKITILRVVSHQDARSTKDTRLCLESLGMLCPSRSAYFAYISEVETHSSESYTERERGREGSKLLKAWVLRRIFQRVAFTCPGACVHLITEAQLRKLWDA